MLIIPNNHLQPIVLKKQLLLFCCLFGFFTSYGQDQLNLFGLNHLVDQQSVNPSYIGNHRFELTLFPLASNIYSNGPTYQDFIGNREVDNVLRYPENQLAFGQDNLLRVGSTIETFRFIYNQKNWSISINHAAKTKGILDYSGALLAVAIQGNAPFIGQNLSLNTDFSAFSYGELGIGGALQLDKLKIGGRFKYLAGHSAAITRQAEIALLTDDDIYQLSLDTEIEVDIAGQNGDLSAFNFGPIGLNFTNNEDVIIDAPSLLFNLNDDLFNFSDNHGFAFDIGFDWQINEQLNLTFSALDLGKINWTDNAKNYTANQIFEFDGINLGQLTFDGSEIISFDNVQDSVDIIDFVGVSQDFSTNLPAQFYLGLGYTLNEKLRINTTLFYSDFQDNSFTALSLGANYQIQKNINIGSALNLMNETSLVLGLNATLELGPLQVFALTDNVFGLFDLTDNRTLNARVGVGFSFGKHDDLTMLPKM